MTQAGSKRLTSLAELVCQTCRASGVTSMDLLEHNLTAKTKEAVGDPYPNRFLLTGWIDQAVPLQRRAQEPGLGFHAEGDPGRHQSEGDEAYPVWSSGAYELAEAS